MESPVSRSIRPPKDDRSAVGARIDLSNSEESLLQLSKLAAGAGLCVGLLVRLQMLFSAPS